MDEKRRIQFERYTNLPLGGNWTGEWPAYVLVHHEGSVDDVRYVPERTCRIVPMDAAGDPPYRTGNWILNSLSDGCSECGCPFDTLNSGTPNFCPNCGARVVNDGA